MTGAYRRDLRLGLIAATIALLLAALAFSASPAPAYTAPKRCGTIEANGRTYAIRGHLIRCRFARRASAAFLRRGVRPDGWSCVRYPASQTRIAFTCRRGRKDFYAIRR